jgi:hypothetical protein
MKCTHSRKPGSWSYDGCCSDCWVSRAEKAEADNAALRKLCGEAAEMLLSATAGGRTGDEAYAITILKAAAEGK